jgi:hypothetical protein
MKKINQPIFIHSLFRSGSTYIFNVFRRAKYAYICFQEPLHEMAVLAKNRPDDLIVNFGDHEASINRHPKLEKPYFSELFEAWPAWQEHIKEKYVYQSYFANKKEDVGIGFWQSLTSVAKGRPVFQECRTSGRIGAIKNYIGGLHLYLWRNPWDQWWSYKINNYFEAANQLIIHADNPPAPLRLMLAAMDLPRFDGKGVVAAIQHYQSTPKTTEESYLVFYMLWCLALREGTTYADLIFSIDRLSDSKDYQHEILIKLQKLGIDGVDFSDCSVPQGVYSEKDKAFFGALEAKVHLWLLEGGWKQAEIDAILNLRKDFAPKQWSQPVANLNPETLVDLVERFSELSKRFETTNAKNERAADKNRFETESKIQQLERQYQDARTKDEQCQNNLGQAIQAVQQSQAQLQEMVGIVNQSNRLAQEAESRAAQSEKMAQEAESQAALSEVRAQEAESRAAQSEKVAQEAESQAALSEVRAQEAESRAYQSVQMVEKLNSEIASQRTELHNVLESNHHHWNLANQRWQELIAVYNSKSWRITAPLRWPVNQFRLLKMHGFKSRAKALINKLLRKLNAYLLGRPKLRRTLLWLSQKIGIYRLLKSWRDRLRSQPDYIKEVLQAENPSKENCEDLTKELMPQARMIYNKLKISIEQRQGQSR